MPRSSRAAQSGQSLVNPYAVDGAPRGVPGVATAAGAVLAGAAGMALLGVGTASAEPGAGRGEPDPDAVSSASQRPWPGTRMLSESPEPDDLGSFTPDERPDTGSGSPATLPTEPRPDPEDRTLAELQAGALEAQGLREAAAQAQARAVEDAPEQDPERTADDAGPVPESRARPSGGSGDDGGPERLDEPEPGPAEVRGAAEGNAPSATDESVPAPEGAATAGMVTAAVGEVAVPEALATRSAGAWAAPSPGTGPAEVRSGEQSGPPEPPGAGGTGVEDREPVPGPGSTSGSEASSTGGYGLEVGASVEEGPWDITTFDEENWPPRLDLGGTDLGYAVGGVVPTILNTANQIRIAKGYDVLRLIGEVPRASLTVPRSFVSDILLGDAPIEVFAGEPQNTLAKSVISGTVITVLDEAARIAQRNLPEIQRRNNDVWVNRGNRLNPPVVTPTPGQMQLSSGLRRPTVFTIAPAATALNLGADALTDRYGLDPDPSDPNNNRYYLELATDSVATGLGVFGPIFTQNYVDREAIALRAGKPVPSAGNVLLDSALAFGLPALQTFGAGILFEEPPDTTDPIYRGTRATARFVADNARRVDEATFGEGDPDDGNAANAVRGLGNAAATLATPVLDALGGVVPRAFHNMGHTYDYLRTGERRPDEPIVSEAALASAEAARARTQGAWAAARQGAARNRWDDLVKLAANGIQVIGRAPAAVAHGVAAPVADPYRSPQSLFLEEPTQAQRARESVADVRLAWHEAGEAVDGLLGRAPSQQAGSSHPTCGGATTVDCVDPRSLVDDDDDGTADNAGELVLGALIGAPVPGSAAYQDCYDRGECGDQSVPGSPAYGDGEAGEGFVGPLIPTDPTVAELEAVYSSPAFARHAERSFAAHPQVAPPQLVDPVRASVDGAVQAAGDGARWIGDRVDDIADAAEQVPVVGGAVSWVRNHVPGLGGDGDPHR